uniref:Uncharacterized protein n=1 Tax=viral metagenome TaxID=1070528 RepID=A0A6C0D9U4_9ZZZZ
MNQERIPVLAYAFIGITSLVLAYATFLDKTSDNNSNDKSATSMLPDVFSKTPIENKPNEPSNNNNLEKEEVPTAPTEPVSNVEKEQSQELPVAPKNLEQKNAIGGKTKRNKKKSRNTKRKIKK